MLFVSLNEPIRGFSWPIILIVLLNFLGYELTANQVLVNTVKREEFFVGASLLDFSLLHTYDLICIADSAQPMRHNHNSLLTTADQLIQGLLHLVFTFSVKGRSCLIEKQKFGFSDESTGDGNSLLLTS